jgi:hypothetical protein
MREAASSMICRLAREEPETNRRLKLLKPTTSGGPPSVTPKRMSNPKARSSRQMSRFYRWHSWRRRLSADNDCSRQLFVSCTASSSTCVGYTAPTPQLLRQPLTVSPFPKHPATQLRAALLSPEPALAKMCWTLPAQLLRSSLRATPASKMHADFLKRAAYAWAS